ncbi:MAG: glycosyltransferase family 4 protein [Candidatus Dormibacteraeota bacterium]|nr:glycosyltransferase family 4 protein [Candidatus Dormibacteraeota bacterium]
MTRVTFVSYDDEPPLGGQGVELRGMRAALTARGHMVTTLAGRGQNEMKYPLITGRAPLDFSISLNVRSKVIRNSRPDVVHALGGPGGVLLLRRALGAPLVYTANHTYRMAHHRGSVRRLLSPLEGLAYRGAAMVLAISPSTATAVRGLGVPGDRIEVLAPGVDAPASPPQPRSGFRLLFAGRWEAEKGVLEAIDVMREVIARRPGATATVVGSGRLAGRVRAAATGIPGLTVAGRVDDERLAREYAEASAVLVPSRYEGLGLVALEGQARGAVVVGYDVDGLRDATAERSLLVDPGDVAGMVRLCVHLNDEPARRDQLGRAAHQWVRERHSWERIGARLEEVYAAVRTG